MLDKVTKCSSLGIGLLVTFTLSSCTNPVSVIYDGSHSSAERIITVALKHEDGSDVGEIPYDYCRLVAPKVIAGSKTNTPVATSCFIKISKTDLPLHLKGGKRKPLPNALLQSAATVCDASLLHDELESEFRPATKVSAMGLTTLGEENWLIYDKTNHAYYLFENADVKSEDCFDGDLKDAAAVPW